MRFIDLTGETFGRLFVIETGGHRGKDVLWRCRCDCGKEHYVISPSLRRGLTRSCGCLEDESRRRRMLRRPTIIDGDVVRIPLTRGLVAIVDRQDADLGLENWAAFRGDGRWYACRRMPMPDGRTVLLHREVAKRAGMEIEGMEVDHQDGDGLNCRRSNLRAATSSQNKCNRGPSSTSRSGIKGVRWYARRNKWTARIGINGEDHHLGYFTTKEDAAAAYADAARALHGEFARTS